MNESKVLKLCTCKEPAHPSTLPCSPEEYSGTGICGKCDGVIKYPYSKKITDNDLKPAFGKLSLQNVAKHMALKVYRNGDLTQEDLLNVLLLNIAQSLSNIKIGNSPKKGKTGEK